MPEDRLVNRLFALFVEDDEKLLAARRELLDQSNFVTFGARSYQEAMRQFRSGPTFALVVTDVNLDPQSPTDRSGIALARELTRLSPNLPIVGYSAHFNEDQIRGSDRAVFRAYIGKGRLTPRELLEQAHEWEDLAVAYLESRPHWIEAELERLRQKYQMRERDFEILRSFVPGTCSSEGPDELLKRAGYRLHLIEPGERRPSVDDEPAEPRVMAPIPVWIRTENGSVLVEVAGFPSLYGHAPSRSEAVTQLLLLMDGYLKDLNAEPPRDDTPEVKHLHDFLRHVLG